jgi:hypothetical protein
MPQNSNRTDNFNKLNSPSMECLLSSTAKLLTDAEEWFWLYSA